MARRKPVRSDSQPTRAEIVAAGDSACLVRLGDSTAGSHPRGDLIVYLYVNRRFAAEHCSTRNINARYSRRPTSWVPPQIAPFVGNWWDAREEVRRRGGGREPRVLRSRRMRDG